jgi:hypothetical protein
MKRSRALSLTLVLLIAIGSAATVAQAGTCQYEEGGCVFTVELTEYTGPPPIPFCILGVPLVEVTVTARCKGNGTGGDSQVVCGALADPVVVTVGSKTITVQPITGHDWEDALGNCAKFLDVTVN